MYSRNTFVVFSVYKMATPLCTRVTRFTEQDCTWSHLLLALFEESESELLWLYFDPLAVGRFWGCRMAGKELTQGCSR